MTQFRPLLLATTLALAVVAFACDELGSTSEDSTAAGTPLVERDGGWWVEQPDDLLLGRVDRVIDGDTLDVVIAGEERRIRVFGIAAAERGERCYNEATDALRSLAGSEVRVLPDDRREDDFGRWLRYLFTPDGRSIDAALVASGNVEAWRDDGAYRDTLTRLERTARETDTGCLWQ